MNRATSFAVQLHKQASQYFADFKQDEVNVRLVSRQIRPASVFYRFDLSARGLHRSILVKIPTKRSENVEIQPDVSDQFSERRPLLTSITDPGVKFQLEYTALSEIHDYFSDLSDPRFGVIRVLDFFPDQQAIVMEEVSNPSLRQLFMKAGRLSSLFTATDLDAAFHNAGAWLHAYHALPKSETVPVRNSRRADFIDSITNFTDFLARVCDDETFFQKVKLVTTAHAFRELPESLSLGLLHGDYAMRNILVGPDSQVTVLDTLAKWRMPIYTDIGCFLVALKTTRTQVLSQGLAFSRRYLRRCEENFLEGYFGHKPIPYKAVWLYEIQALLDKWAFTVTRLKKKQARGRYVSPEVLQLALLNRFFRKRANALLQKIDTYEDPVVATSLCL